MRRILMVAFVLGLAGLPAWGKSRLFTSMKEVLDEADKAGRLALIIYVPPGQGGGQPGMPGGARMVNPSSDLRDFMLKNPANQQLILSYFEVGEIDYRTAGAKGNEHLNKLAVDGRISLPAWVIATPDGDYIDGGDATTVKSGKPPWRERLLAAARKYPPIGEKDRKKADEMLAQAQKDLAAGQVKRAAAVLPKITPVWFPKKFVEDRKKLSVLIEQKSEDALEAADALNSDGKLAEAALAYERIKRQYPSELPVVPKATKKQRDLLERNKELLLEFAKLKKNEEAVEALDEARRLAEEPATLPKAKMLYRTVIQAHGDSPLATQAKEELEKLDSAPPVAKTDPKDKSAKGPDKPADPNKPVIPKPDNKGEAPVILLPDK